VAGLLKNIAPLEPTVGVGLHFSAYLFLEQDCIWVLGGSGWDFPNRSGPWDRHTGAVGILRVKFVPEPSGWVMLIVGIAILAFLFRRRKQCSA
jgi:hypothetical protein